MPRPELAFQRFAELADVDPGSESLRVHLLGRGREEDVDARLLGELRVARFVPRVPVEVLAGPELGRVDEQAGDDDVVLGAGGLEQREVTRVKCAHRRDQADRAFVHR